MDANQGPEALTRTEDGESENTDDWGSAEESNAMVKEVATSVNAGGYQDDDWMDETENETPNDDMPPPGEMELIFENEYIV